jgi:hypothetical protein
MFKNVRSLVESSDKGEGHTCFWHKTTLPTPTATRIIDLSMGAGIPKYNAYVGAQAAATPLYGNGNEGIYLGALPSSGKTRYVNRVLVQPQGNSFSPANLFLLDYLMFYPLIDGDDVDIQAMDNTNTLPRYTNGKDVRIMLVCTTPMTTDANVTINYTNQDGVAGRSTLVNISGIGSQTGYTVTRGISSTNAVTPFVHLQGGDTGVRSIESIQLLGPTGGFFCAVLVKVITTVQTQDIGVSSEVYSIQHKGGSLPSLQEGAYLNWICQTANTTSLVPFRGEIDIIWQ